MKNNNKDWYGKDNRKKAQHLVELMLFFPFFCAILGMLLDFSMSLYSNYRFSLALQEVVTHAWADRKLGSSEDMRELIEKRLAEQMQKKHIAYSSNVVVAIPAIIEDTSIIVGTYEYTPVFTLLHAIIPGMPKRFSFRTVIPINASILKQNFYALPENDLSAAFGSGDVLPKEPEEEEDGGNDANKCEAGEPGCPEEPPDEGGGPQP